MSTAPMSRELLSESEATLRLVDTVVSELRGADAEVAEHVAGLVPSLDADNAPDLARLPSVLLSAYAEIVGVLQRLEASRGILQRVAMDRLQRTHQKLTEVSAATEVAAGDMLDGLDRSLSLLERLDDPQLPPDVAAATRDSIRDELHTLITCLQFQDITSQQLTHASSVLFDLEDRLRAMVAMFGAELVPEPVGSGDLPGSGATTFDPAASTRDAEGRQALADEIFFPAAARGR